MGKPKAPTPPDPYETAGAATGTNIGTAIANTAMGNINQVGPAGSLTYDQTGTYDWTDPNSGQVYQLPQYTATQSLSDAGQGIFDQSQGAQMGLATAANNLAGNIDSSPMNFDTGAVEGHLFDLASNRLDPMMERRRSQLETRLANQGLTPGSAAWQAEMGQFGQQQNDMYNQLALTGRGQALNEMYQQRSQPINEISALLSGSQVQQPNYQTNAPSQAATVDIGGLINANYGQQQQNYQQQMANRQSLMGGLFGLGAGLI